MGLREAKKYISDLHRKQRDPNQWPDFVTGLPDRAAALKKAAEVIPKLGVWSIIYIRIENIEPYLAKYGTARHVEIIQWAAALLHTTAQKHGCFVGTMNRHDFLAVCRTGQAEKFVEEAQKLFDRKARSFYHDGELQSNSVMSFRSDGREISFGLMQLTACIKSESNGVSSKDLIPYIENCCAQ